jgi:MFS family permease
MLLVVWLLADLVLSRSPEQMGLVPDGDSPKAAVASRDAATAKPLPRLTLWRDRRFLTLSAGMSLGLFAQLGLTAHLFSLLLPALGAQLAGLTMGMVAAMAIVGRTLLGWMMPANADRRLMACTSYAIQIAGSIALVIAAGVSIPLLLLGAVLFGLGFGNGTFLPPLIAQSEFAREDVSRAVALIVAIAQGAYSFAPAAFGLIQQLSMSGDATGNVPHFYLAAALMQTLAILVFLAGRQKKTSAALIAGHDKQSQAN